MSPNYKEESDAGRHLVELNESQVLLDLHPPASLLSVSSLLAFSFLVVALCYQIAGKMAVSRFEPSFIAS